MGSRVVIEVRQRLNARLLRNIYRVCLDLEHLVGREVSRGLWHYYLGKLGLSREEKHELVEVVEPVRKGGRVWGYVLPAELCGGGLSNPKLYTTEVEVRVEGTQT